MAQVAVFVLLLLIFSCIDEKRGEKVKSQEELVNEILLCLQGHFDQEKIGATQNIYSIAQSTKIYSICLQAHKT